MGLRDWVSEKGRRPTGGPEPLLEASMGVRDWVSEKVSDIVEAESQAMRLQWGSETGSRRRPGGFPTVRCSSLCFNGAPRLGLGEGRNGWPVTQADEWVASMGLRDWVSEKETIDVERRAADAASMGLRDWVSEKGRGSIRPGPGSRRFNGAPRLGLGEGR